MMNERASGILCHISSLPSPYGIGDLGPEAYRFVDFLAKSKQKYWQVLPLNPTEDALGNSPYSSFSAFAWNTLLISPDILYEEGFLERKVLETIRSGECSDIDYSQAQRVKTGLLKSAWSRYSSRSVKLKGFEQFCVEQAYWLDDFALFVVLKNYFNNQCWAEWPVEFRDRDPKSLKEFSSSHADDILREKFFQFLFYRQWMRLQEYCSQNGVGIIGDIPIYVNYDGVDVWVNPGLFKLDKDKRPTFVAGVPPDYFSEDGQRWGNPLFNWDRLRDTGFAWWVERVRHNLLFFDYIRIDHFRAFAQCWEIPVDEKTAKKGAWKDVPGIELFQTLKEKIPQLPIIAEDLGIITQDVDDLKEKFGFPGMAVVLFAFHNDYKKSRNFPDNCKPLSVVYTGTHDNNTVRGWYDKDITKEEEKNMLEYLGKMPDSDSINWVMIEMAFKSMANLAIIPLQDVLGLGAEARMNKPSTARGNWKWRFQSGILSRSRVEKLKRLAQACGRAIF
ncbi:MAG: 4-alpha-glucanotransferase [Candidatus Omnitrophica bacterium]|nr:4-alpha-glucanotransferase [Candidatus Omnitrophota bacterium]